METTDGFTGLVCVNCGETVEAETGAGVGAETGTTARCPDCDGLLEATYDLEAIASSVDRETLESRPFDSLWRYAELLPFPRSAAVTIDEGATPLVECEKLATELGVGRVLIKDEGRNPTGSIADRGASLAVTAALESGATDIALASPGDSGQSIAAYAGRADSDNLEAHVYLPSRSGFSNKAMVNVHGGDMTVVGGRYAEAASAVAEGLAEHEAWDSIQPVLTPYHLEGIKTVAYEIFEGLEWTSPDAIVTATGSGLGIAGLYKGSKEFHELGLIDSVPSLYAAQADGCAPIVEAVDAGATQHDPIEYPDTICGGIEIPDPDGGTQALEAIRATDGGAVATEDEDILEAAIAVAKGEGIELTPSSAAAASGAWELAEQGVFDGEETVVIVGTAAGSKEADVLRSHLMGKGI